MASRAWRLLTNPNRGCIPLYIVCSIHTRRDLKPVIHPVPRHTLTSDPALSRCIALIAPLVSPAAHDARGADAEPGGVPARVRMRRLASFACTLLFKEVRTAVAILAVSHN
jgi:hypothetical protein